MSSNTEEHTPQFKSKKENIRAIQFLGGGSFGNVFEIEEDTSEFSQPLSFAVKQISVEKYKFYFQNEVTPFSKILREVHLLKQIGEAGVNQDPGQTKNSTDLVVKLYDDWVEGIHAGNEEELDKSFKTANPNFSSGQTPPPTRNWLFIKMELCHITLDDWLKREEVHNPDDYASPSQHLKIIKQLLQGLSFIHNYPPKGVVHRDIKPANIFLNCSAAGVVAVKLGDFGLGRVLREDKSRVTTLTLGSARYKSPEMLKQDGYYDTKTDVFSMGLVILEVIVNYEGGIYGEKNPDEIQKILSKLFYLLQVGKLPGLGDEMTSEVLNLEIEIVTRMTAFDKKARLTADVALDYVENLDKFSTLLAKERKEARLVYYNVPPPTTLFLRGRQEKLQEIKNFLLNEPSTSVLWLSGPMGIGMTELTSNFARKSKGEMHCVWLDYHSISTNLSDLVASLGIDSEENPELEPYDDHIELTLLNLVVTDLIRRDSTVPILFIFHDIFYTFEASELVEKLVNSGNNALLKFILVTKFNPPDSLPSLSSKIVKLEPLDLPSSTLLLKDCLPTQNLDLEKHSYNIQEVARLTFQIPGLIRRLCDYINSLMLTSNPMSLDEAITLLRYDMGTLLKFKGARGTSFYSQWQDIKQHYIDLEAWEYKSLQVLSFAFPHGKGDTSILSETCNKSVGTLFKEEIDLDKFKFIASDFNICSVLVDRGSYSGQSLQIYPLINELIKLEFITLEKEVDSGSNVLVQLLNLAKKSGSIDEFGGTPQTLFHTLWEWLAREDDLREKYLPEFIQFTTNLGGSWELPPLNEGSNRFDCRAWAQDKFKQLQQDLINSGLGEDNPAVVTIRCYQIVYNVSCDISKSLEPFINLRNFLIENKEVIANSYNNLSKFLLEHCCPLVSKFIFEKNYALPQSDKDLIKGWIMSEISEIDDGLRDVDFVVFSFLPFLRGDDYRTILDIGEALISKWFKYREVHQPNQLIVLVVFLCITINDHSAMVIPEMGEMLNKLGALGKFNFPSVSQGLHLWKLWLFDKWPKWFAKSLFFSGNKLPLIVNLLLHIFIKSGDTQQEWFAELGATYAQFLESLGKGREQSIEPLNRRYKNILQEISQQAEELFGIGVIPRFYRNYLKSEVNQCCAQVNLEIDDPMTASSLDIEIKKVNDWTPFLVGLAMYGTYPDLGEMLDKNITNKGENDVIMINENGHFAWSSNNLSNLPISATTLDRVKQCLEQTSELLMPQIVENFVSIYPQLGGGVLVHLLLSPLTVQYRGQLMQNFATHCTDEATLKSVVTLVSEMLQLNTQICDITTLFDFSVALVGHLFKCENFDIGTHLLKTLIREFSTHYEGRGRLVSLGENFATSENLSPLGVEIGIRETCVGLMDTHWEEDCSIKCLNLLRSLMKIRMKAKFSTPFATGENMGEQFDKILGYFNKIGVGVVAQSSKFSVSLASIIFLLCLDKNFPGKEDDAVKVLGEIVKYYVEREEFYEILKFGESIGFGASGWKSTKFWPVWEKVCRIVEIEGESLSFSKVEELLKIKLFTVKDNEGEEQEISQDEDGIVL